MITIAKARLSSVILTIGCTVLMALPAMAADSVKAKLLNVERPTLISEGFDWRIEGDDNRNASVIVKYRKKGEIAWKSGLPFLRAGGDGETVGIATGSGEGGGAARFAQFKYVVPNMLAGSIFHLDSDTDYQAQLTLSDPDGGGTSRTVSFHTRKEPKPYAGGQIYNVYPVDWKGPKQEPAFTGIMAAYYMGGAHYDYENAYPPRVQPGDTILVHGGLYVGDRYHYMNTTPRPGFLALGNYFDGTYYLTASGTADKPIAIKAAGDGEVIFDGDGAQTLFNLMGANYNYFEGITVRNTNVAFLLGIKNIAGGSGFTLKQSKLYNVGRAVEDDWSGTKDIYVADNDMNGRHDPVHMMSWSGARWMPFPNYPEVMGGDLGSEYAIKIYGQGNVVAYNKITNFHDGVDFATYGVPDGVTLPDGSAAKEIADRFPESNDFYGNDISNMGDNCIETDGTGRNMRVFENRCFNLASTALSVQPGFGGPVYWIHNIVYNTNGVFKYIENSAGILTYNNTLIGEGRPTPAQNMHFRNNLILGENLTDPVFALTSSSNTNDADYDGFRPNPGKDDAFQWNTPPDGVLHAYEQTPMTRKFKTLAQMAVVTGQEKHGVLVDYNIFQQVAPPNIADVQHVYDPADYDFRLRAGSAAVDAGVELPNITEGFSGKAPDLGAIEFGQPMPHFGPRGESKNAIK
jgi:hypothetical protein